MKEVLREEFKYELSPIKALLLKNNISAIMNEDIHNKTDGYLVRSLYFDTNLDGDYYDKASGIEHRRKIRIRVYDPDSEVAYLEMKQKSGKYQKKRTLKISKTDAEEIIKCNFEVLKNYDNDFAKEMASLMQVKAYRPKVVVDYKRLAFTGYENETRITFDSEISSNESDFDIFNKNLCVNQIFSLDKTVLEVKYNGFLMSYIKDVISSADEPQTAISKYCYARTTII